MTLATWLAGRSPRVPDAFQSHVAPQEPDRVPATAAERVDLLASEAQDALGRAGDRDVADRAGAFDLLAADAWATWAAEATLEADDPVAALTDLARRFADPVR